MPPAQDWGTKRHWWGGSVILPPDIERIDIAPDHELRRITR